MAMSEELKPCPFCGGKADRQTIGDEEPNNAGGDVIVCRCCQASSHVEFGRKENLVSRWNTRAALATPQPAEARGMVEAGERKGDWMQVASGRPFWPLDPRADEVHIDDIAHGLSMLCRFGGHTQRFYSVAEHSVWVSRIVPPEHAFQALMHDATEAYCVDIPRPLKRGLSNYAEIEAGIWAAVSEQFGLPADLDSSVKAADNAMCLAEAAQIMARPEIDWSATGCAADVTVECWSPQEAKRQFLARFHELASFDVREPYYLASCDHCGWVGSSEHCGTDSLGDDSDVYCPRCQTSGADCGKMATAALSATLSPQAGGSVTFSPSRYGFPPPVEQSSPLAPADNAGLVEALGIMVTAFAGYADSPGKQAAIGISRNVLRDNGAERP